jgi:hypothetical protein
MSPEEVARCDVVALAERLRAAEAVFRRAGADAIIESAADLLPVLNELGVSG